MSLTLVADVGAENANAYTDVVTADAWLALRVGAGAWAGFDGDLKIQALVTATRDIDAIEGTESDAGVLQYFVGERATDIQALEWPRTGTDYADDALPERLIQATIELAFVYATQATADATADVLNPDTNNGNIKVEKVGPISTEYFAATAATATAIERLPAVVQRLLGPLLRVAYLVGQYGSAQVYRGS